MKKGMLEKTLKEQMKVLKKDYRLVEVAGKPSMESTKEGYSISQIITLTFVLKEVLEAS